MIKSIQLLLFLAVVVCCLAQTTSALRGGGQHPKEEQRNLQESYYSVVTDKAELGFDNVYITKDNPLKGIASNPRWTMPQVYNGSWPIPNSIEFFYIGVDEVMFDNPDVVGEDNAFDWTAFEEQLDKAEARNSKAIPRFFFHFPRWALRVPLYLIENGLTMIETTVQGNLETIFDYGDPLMTECMEQFIRALGKKYDGDPRIMSIQMGLLGCFGEWHMCGADDDLLPLSLKTDVGQWFYESFQTTMIQARLPGNGNNDKGFGYHDDVFVWFTLDGEYNGGVDVPWFFWHIIENNNLTDFYRTNVMGGEVNPVHQELIFTDDYRENVAGTRWNQDFDTCVEVTHATTLLVHHAFLRDTPYSGRVLENALDSISKMGYNFRVTQVAALDTGAGSTVDIDVTIEQVGVAPFYFPLSVTLTCPSMTGVKEVPGVEDIIGYGEFETFRFTSVPATLDCLSDVTFELKSSYINRPIKFAQSWNGLVQLNLPLPGSTDGDGEKLDTNGSCKNLISNSDMEQGDSGFWESTRSSIFGGFSTGNFGVDGSKAIRYRKPWFGDGKFAYVADIDASCITAGSTYQISAYIKLVARSGRTRICSNNCPVISVTVLDSSGNVMASNDTGSFEEDGDFSHYTAGLVIPAGSAVASEVSIEVTGMNIIWDVVIDDFEIVLQG